MSDALAGTHGQTPDERDALARRHASPFRAGDAVPGLSSWILERKLGGGGFGDVWLVRHKWDADQKPRAVKFCTDPVARHRLVTHEQNVVVRVMKYAGKHPNIVPLLECNLDGDVPWLMYEFVDGGTLAAVAVPWRELPPERRLGRAVEVLYPLAGALAAMHRLNPPIVHRDLKPQNVLMAGAVPRVTDFGIGSVALPESPGETTGAYTAAAARIPSALQGAGTRLYAPPEQMLGAPPHPRDDVYALGIIAYQLALGDLSIAPGTDAALELDCLKVPGELASLVVRSVAMNPDRRPMDAGEWEATLGKLLDREPWGGGPGESAVVPQPRPESPALVPTDLPPRDTRPDPETAPPAPPRPRWTLRTAFQRLPRLTYPRFVIGSAALLLLLLLVKELAPPPVDPTMVPPRSDPATVALFSRTWMLTKNVGGISGGGVMRPFDAGQNVGWTFYRDGVSVNVVTDDSQRWDDGIDRRFFTAEYQGDKVVLTIQYAEVKDWKRYPFSVRIGGADDLELVLDGSGPDPYTLTFRGRPRPVRYYAGIDDPPGWMYIWVQLIAALLAHRKVRGEKSRVLRMTIYWLVHSSISLASLPLGFMYDGGFLSPRLQFCVLTLVFTAVVGFLGGLIHLLHPRQLSAPVAASR